MNIKLRVWQFPLLVMTFAALACSAGGSDAGGGSGAGSGGDADSGDAMPEGTPDINPFDPCVPGQWQCAGNVFYECGEDSESHAQEIVCPEACSNLLGCVTCVPGARRCLGNVASVCKSDATGWNPLRDCAEWGSQCASNGFCGDECGFAESMSSNVGCEYWPVPLGNLSSLHAVFDYRVVAGNPNNQPAHVTVTRGSNVVWENDIPPNGLAEIKLPWINGQSKWESGDGTAAKNWKSIVVGDGAYRLKSSIPVAVAQFNPFEYQNDAAKNPFGNNPNGNSFTNDASLLLPTHTLTGDYVNVSFVPTSVQSGLSYGKIPGYLALVGVSTEPTTVRVQVSGHAAADKENRWPQTAPGGWIELTLQRGEVAHIAAAAPPNCVNGRPGYGKAEDINTCYEHEYDLTGSRISADRPVQAFGGHVCAYVPHHAQACDHMEVQLPPIQSWGRSYVSRPMTDGEVAEKDQKNLVRVIAAFDNTTITVSPPQDGVDTRVINANEHVQFMASEPFSVTGTTAIMVAQYMLGQRFFPNPDTVRGDPSLTVLVPAEQYRKDYDFIAPTSYNPTTKGQNYLLITRKPGSAVALNGTTVGGTWKSAGGWEMSIVPIEGGTHRLESGTEFGAMVFGVGAYTSYLYPAGLNVAGITDIR